MMMMMMMTTIGPGEDLTTLSLKNDHLGVLRYIRAHELREPQMVIQHGKALLRLVSNNNDNDAGTTTTTTKTSIITQVFSSLDAASHTAALEQVCLAALDVKDMDLAHVCLKELSMLIGFVTTNTSDNKKNKTKQQQLQQQPSWACSNRFQRLSARCLEAVGDYHGAMMVYNEMLKKNPANVVALQRRYCVLRAQQKQQQQQQEEDANVSIEEVVEALNEYLGQQLSDVAGWYEMAQLRLSLADYQGAAYALEQVILGCPLEADLHRQLAEVYATLGGLEYTMLARKHMAQAWELNPTDLRAQFGLVYVANQYLEESTKRGSKRQQQQQQNKEIDEHEQQVAKELVKFGATKVLHSYRNTKMFACVKRVMEDFTDNI
jgi:tetratricopeptide (TPR) repeat protein